MEPNPDGITMKQHFDNIKQQYDAFENFLLKNGQVLSKDTELGHWGVSYLPAVFKLFEEIDLKKHHAFVDLGSGDGRVALVAGLFSHKSHGIEHDDWLLGCSNTIKGKIPQVQHVTFAKEDFMDHDLSKYDVLFHSPDKPYYRGTLNQKLLRELQGTLIVHGWEFHPSGLIMDSEHIIDGEMFRLYSNPNK